MSPRAYVIDTSRWPLARIVMPAEDPDRDSFEAYLTTLDAFCSRGHPFVILLDLRPGGMLSGEQRERLRQNRLAMLSETRRYQRGIAFVVTSTFQRAVLTAILWVAPEPTPARIFPTLPEAEAWLMTCLNSPSDARTA
jgi:hypothetical protein